MLLGISPFTPMKTALSLALLTLATVAPTFAQINAPSADIALRRFFGISSLQGTVPIAQPSMSGFATVLLFKDGKFWKRVSDTPLRYNFAATPVAWGNSKAGYAPATAQIELLWGERDGEMGYLFRANIGTGGVVPNFTPMPEFATINGIFSDIVRDPSRPQYSGMAIIGVAFATPSKPASASKPTAPAAEYNPEAEVASLIADSTFAALVVYQDFPTEEAGKTFLAELDQKFPK